MRILAVTNLYPGPGRELIAAFNRQQFAALAGQCELRVIAPVAWPTAWKEAIRGKRTRGRHVNPDGVEVEHPVYYYPPRILRHRYGECYLRSIRRAAERAITEHRPDVLLSCWTHPDGWAAVQIGREHRLPVVIKAIGSDLLVAANDPRRRIRISDALSGADGVVTVSRHLAEHALLLGAEAARVRVVPEGLNESVFFPGDRHTARLRLGLPPDEQVVLFVGNLLWTKGVGLLVKACRSLVDRGAQFHCYLIGGGADAAKLRSLVRAERLESRVSLAGSCAHAELPNWYQAADVVALPSYSEGIPNVLREALACGRPFVASDVGGIPEIAHPSYSRLIPRGDAAALADSLTAMLASPPIVDRQLVRSNIVSCQRSAELLAESLKAAFGSRTERVKQIESQVVSQVAAV